MTLVFAMLTLQVFLGAFDNLWHHELTENLPHKPTARLEIALHAAREFLYALIFIGIAWFRWEGFYVYVLLALLGIEIIITLTDFVIEDQTRRLPKLERVLHTVLAINFGATLALWAPELTIWAARPAGLVSADYGWWSLAFTAFGVSVLAWGVRDLFAAVRLGVPQWQRNPMKLGTSGSPRTVLVTGATGFIGRAAVRALIERGDSVVALSRDPVRARYLFGPHVAVVASLDSLKDDVRIDAIVNLAGEPLIGGLWTRRRKRVFVESRVGMTENLAALVRRLKHTPDVLVNGSAIGIYGDRGDAALTEASVGQDMFMSELCVRWEMAARSLETLGVRVCRMRIGLVLGRDGGVLPSMALPMHFGATTQFGSGRQWMSWIHRDDLVRLILFAMDNQTLAGPINATAPHPVTHRDFMSSLGRRFGWQVRLAIPGKLLKLALGELSSLFLASQRVFPEVALAHAFEFRFGHLDAALTDLVGKHRQASGPEGIPAAYLNESCPICSAELTHYRRVADAAGAKLEICEIGKRSHDLVAYGLKDADLRRRLYAVRSDGTVCSGVDAFVAIWSRLPAYRVLAAMVRLPGIYQVADFAYEGIVVPWLSAHNRRRRARAIRLGSLRRTRQLPR